MKNEEWKIRFPNFAIAMLKVSQGGPCPKGGRAGCWPSCTMAEAAPSADMIRRDQPEARSGILERYIKSDQIVRGTLSNRSIGKMKAFVSIPWSPRNSEFSAMKRKQLSFFVNLW